jgi:NAD(P)H dehydrogenase (quinone)
MSTTSSIAVTGSTGVVGGMVAARLAAEGVGMRLVVRDPSRATAYPGSEVRKAEYADSAASRAALDGVELLFMVSAAENEHRVDEHLAFVEAAAAVGVRHVVYTSFYGASPAAEFRLGRDHWATEEAIRASGMAFTFLRDNLYLDFLRFFAGEERVIRGPAGDGRLSAVAQRDVAASAAAVLLDPATHVGATYHLTGQQDLSMSEWAALLSTITGDAYGYVDETVEEAYASRAQYNAAPWQLDAWVSTYTAVRDGEMAGVSGDVEQLTGRPPTTLEELLQPS